MSWTEAKPFLYIFVISLKKRKKNTTTKSTKKMEWQLPIVRQASSVLRQHLCLLVTFTTGQPGSSDRTLCLLLCFKYLENSTSGEKKRKKQTSMRLLCPVLGIVPWCGQNGSCDMNSPGKGQSILCAAPVSFLRNFSVILFAPQLI